jgi:hypothetical protein
MVSSGIFRSSHGAGVAIQRREAHIDERRSGGAIACAGVFARGGEATGQV